MKSKQVNTTQKKKLTLLVYNQTYYKLRVTLM